MFANGFLRRIGRYIVRILFIRCAAMVLLIYQFAQQISTSGVHEMRSIGDSTVVLPYDCPLIDLLRNDNNPGAAEYSDSAVQLLALFLNEGDTVLDVFGGCGLRFAAFAQMVGSTGRLVGIERLENRMVALHETVLKNGWWSRVLLVHCSLQATELAYQLLSSILSDKSTAAADEIDSESNSRPPAVTLKNVIDIIGGSSENCPSLLVIGGYGRIVLGTKERSAIIKDADIFKALLGSRMVLETCKPVVYFTCQNMRTILSLRWLFQEVGYRMYHHSSTNINRGGEVYRRIQHFAAIAFPSAHPRLEEKMMDSFHLSAIPMPLAQAKTRVPVGVDVTDLAHPTSIISRSFRSSAQSGSLDQLSRALGELRTLRTECGFDLLNEESADLRDAQLDQAEVVCLVWANRLVQRMREWYTGTIDVPCPTEIDLCHTRNESLLVLEEVLLIKHCTTHIYKRLSFNIQLLLRRSTESQRLNASNGSTPLHASMFRFGLSGAEGENRSNSLSIDDLFTGNVEGKETDLQQSIVMHGNYYYYDYPSANSASNKFFRKPFGYKYDWTICGEPIWCSHTIEMQKLIHRWQHPHTNNAESVGFDLKLQELGMRRTCNTSRILVYEPPSHKMGIGAIFQLIVAAMRYAICLNRILVLNWKEEQTMQKWRHPGCQAATFECYFEDISDCTVTEADLMSAPRSYDGEGFDEFPLRNERVLILRGIAMKGECQTCYSTWRRDSTFFDGYFFGQTKELPAGTSREFIHMGAFMGGVKETWTAQFLRYLLRPRKWFSQQIEEIINLTLVSPLSDGVSSDADKKLIPHSFPAQFASLHIRYGMKVVELELQPISRYMNFLQKKLPHLKDIFVSTETESVVETLVRYSSVSTETSVQSLRIVFSDFMCVVLMSLLFYLAITGSIQSIGFIFCGITALNTCTWT